MDAVSSRRLPDSLVHERRARRACGGAQGSCTARSGPPKTFRGWPRGLPGSTRGHAPDRADAPLTGALRFRATSEKRQILRMRTYLASAPPPSNTAGPRKRVGCVSGVGSFSSDPRRIVVLGEGRSSTRSGRSGPRPERRGRTGGGAGPLPRTGRPTSSSVSPPRLSTPLPPDTVPPVSGCDSRNRPTDSGASFNGDGQENLLTLPRWRVTAQRLRESPSSSAEPPRRSAMRTASMRFSRTDSTRSEKPFALTVSPRLGRRPSSAKTKPPTEL
jgi:hypothetical protein